MDAKEKKKIYALLGLCVFAAGLAYWRFAPKTNAVKHDAEAGSAAVPSAFDATQLRAELDGYAASRSSALEPYQSPRRNPFAWPGQPDAESGVAEVAPDRESSFFRLQAIISSGTDSVASINGNFYKIGDQVGSHRLTSITATSVTLEADGKVITIFPE